MWRLAGKGKAMVPMLIVDDNPEIRRVLRLVLQEEHYEVSEADNGMGALGYLLRTPQSCLVLLDWLMPWLDGIGVLHVVARDTGPDGLGRHANILLTALSDALLAGSAELLQQLAIPVLAKPFQFPSLLATIRQVAARIPVA